MSDCCFCPEASGKFLSFRWLGKWECTVVCADGTEKAPGFSVSDEGITVKLQDIQALVALGRSRNVSAVMTEQTDFAVEIVARVASLLGLYGLPLEVARAATNKGIMRAKAQAAGISQPQFRVCRSLEHAWEAVKQLGPPIFFKPVDGQSSRGVGPLLSDDKDEVERAFIKAASNSFAGEVIFETMLEGKECTVEGFVNEGQPSTLAISDKTHFPQLAGVARTLTYPAAFSEEVLPRIASANEETVKALGITHGITHAEFIVDKKGIPWLVEIAARGGGSRISTLIVPVVCGFHPTPALIRQLMRRPVEVKVRAPRGVELRFISLPIGKRIKLIRI